jgi:hypothetical protein
MIFDVLGTSGPYGETGERREEAVQNAIHGPQDRPVSALVNAHIRWSDLEDEPVTRYFASCGRQLDAPGAACTGVK